MPVKPPSLRRVRRTPWRGCYHDFRGIGDMTGIEYLTDQDGKPRAVVLPIDLWRRLVPRDDASVGELTEAGEDYCLGKAMDAGRETPLLSREEALAFLKD